MMKVTRKMEKEFIVLTGQVRKERRISQEAEIAENILPKVLIKCLS